VENIVYVIGHRNPDTDSVAAAIAYAALKQQQGQSGVIPAIAGAPNPQTRYVLERLSIQTPLFLADVHPKVRDVLNRQPVTIHTTDAAYDALAQFHGNGVRALPVIDEDRNPVGILSLLRLSETYLLPDQEHHREIITTFKSLQHGLSGTIIATGVAEHDHPITLKLFIGAMREESFLERIAHYDPRQLLIMTGDRRSIQQAAIERGVRILVVTGGHALPTDLQATASENGVTVLLTPHDTASAAWLARLSTPVTLFADQEFTTIGIGEPLTHLRQKLLKSAAVFALEEDGSLAGVATKSSLMASLPYSLILVDHNELAQAVPGADSVEIIEVIDHHKLGNRHTIQPITFIAAPVGSTCTLVAGRYRECNIEPSQTIAALLLAGILSDTVILKSPTTTAIDRSTLAWLETISGHNAAEFGEEMFAACSSLKNFGSPQNIVEADFKLFKHEQHTFGVGQVEVVGFTEFHAMKDELLEVLAGIKKRDNLFIAGLMVTDIVSEMTLFLVEGQTRIAHVMEYPQREPHLYELQGVMSRKKQMIPHLLRILAQT
jgi:manganese-dependent inorganic pyrophosphatase